MEKATGIKTDKWAQQSIHNLKQAGVINPAAKDHLHYSDVLREDLASTLPALELLSMVTFAEAQQRVTALGITCLLEKKSAFHYIWTQLNEGLRKATPILVNPQLLTRLLYTAVGIPLPDPETTIEANLLSTMKNSFIVGNEVSVRTTRKDKGTSISSATPTPLPPPEPVNQNQQSASVQGVGTSSVLTSTSRQQLQIVGVQSHEAEPFNIQQLLQPTPVNHKRHHDASNYFEGFSQKLQRLSTEPPTNVPDEEEEAMKKILEDTAGSVVLATHLVMEQSMKNLEMLFTKREMAVQTSYEAQLQQQKIEIAALQAKLIHKDVQLKELESTLKSTEEKYNGEIKAVSLDLANLKEEHTGLQALHDHMRDNYLKVIQENHNLEDQILDTKRAMKTQAETLKAITQENSALKAMDASERSMMQVDEANRRVTTVFNALGAIGQEICKPRRVSTTLQLLSGNITVAMLYYKVNLKDLDAESFQILLRTGNRTTCDNLFFLWLQI